MIITGNSLNLDADVFGLQELVNSIEATFATKNRLIEAPSQLRAEVTDSEVEARTLPSINFSISVSVA